MNRAVEELLAGDDLRAVVTDAEPDGPDGDSVDQPDEPSVDDAGVIAFEPPVEPGTPSLENALFVLLGVGLALGVVLRLVELFG